MRGSSRSFLEEAPFSPRNKNNFENKTFGNNNKKKHPSLKFLSVSWNVRRNFPFRVGGGSRNAGTPCVQTWVREKFFPDGGRVARVIHHGDEGEVVKCQNCGGQNGQQKSKKVLNTTLKKIVKNSRDEINITFRLYFYESVLFEIESRTGQHWQEIKL